MHEPIATAVRVAATPEQAKVLVAILQAEGIPAHVDGDSLADEVAISRRLMNLGGTRVMVPTPSLERAKEILAAGSVSADELAEQALAAASPELAPRPRPAAVARRTPWFLIGSVVLAGLFLTLWLTEVQARTGRTDPFVRYEAMPAGMRAIRVADNVVVSEYTDEDADGHYEQITQLAADGTTAVFRDDDHDLRYESSVERRGALVYEWRDTNVDGILDVCTVSDAAGKKVQELRLAPGKGFALQQF